MVDPLTAGVPAIWIVLLRLAIGLIWLRSGLIHVLGREYLGFQERLERFMSKNPYPWYRAFLGRYILPHSLAAGYFFTTAQVVLGVALIFGFLTVPAALIATFFNINFRLAAGWQNPSTTPLNYLMIMCQLIVVFSGAGSYSSVDALLFPTGGGG